MTSSLRVSLASAPDTARKSAVSAVSLVFQVPSAAGVAVATVGPVPGSSCWIRRRPGLPFGRELDGRRRHGRGRQRVEDHAPHVDLADDAGWMMQWSVAPALLNGSEKWPPCRLAGVEEPGVGGDGVGARLTFVHCTVSPGRTSSCEGP